MRFEEWARRAELAEAEGKAAWFRAVPEELAASLGLRVYRVGGASVWLTRGIDHYFANGVAALGVMQPATRAAVGAVLAPFRQAGLPCAVDLSPIAQPVQLPRWLRAHGLAPAARDVRLWRTVDDPSSVVSDLRIRVIGPERAAVFTDLSLAGFPAGRPLAAGLAAQVGRPEWLHYLAFDGDTSVATAALFVHEDTAWLGWAYTLPAYRGRGAQSALLARRIADAGARGCTLVVADTGEDTPEQPNPSYRNMLRLGFAHAYTKLIYRIPRAYA